MWDEGTAAYGPQWWRTRHVGRPDFPSPIRFKPVTLATVDFIPSHVDKFTTVFDWGDGTAKGQVETEADDTRKSIVTKQHSYSPTPPKGGHDRTSSTQTETS